MSRNWFMKAAALVLSVGILAGCGGAANQGPQGGENQTPAGQTEQFAVGMVTDLGGLNDQSFNQSAWAGLQRLKDEKGFKVQAVESKRQEDYDPNFQVLVDQEYDLVWGIGSLMGDAIKKKAEELPDTMFAIVDSDVTAPNLAGITFREEEGSFLMGVIAAKTTKTGKVGFIGGMDIDVIHHFEAGYKAGVKATDPNVEVVTVYSGTFTDSNKGKSDALAMYGQGVDIIFHASGNTGTGVIEAAKEQNKYAIGVDQDQNYLAPDNVISSMMKDVKGAVYDISLAAAEGKFPGGQVTVLGLKEGRVGYADSTLWDKMPEGTKDLVDKWADAIRTGKVTVPNSREALESWEVPQI